MNPVNPAILSKKIVAALKSTALRYCLSTFKNTAPAPDYRAGAVLFISKPG